MSESNHESDALFAVAIVGSSKRIVDDRIVSIDYHCVINQTDVALYHGGSRRSIVTENLTKDAAESLLKLLRS